MATIPLPSRRSRLAVATIFFVNGAVLASWVAHIPGVKERHGIGDGSLGFVLLFMARHRQRLLRARRRTGRQRSAALADACLVLLHPGGLEGGDDRHAIHDLARQHQREYLPEREGG